MENKANLFIQELLDRNIIQDITNKEKVINALNKDRKLYVGFDPSANSLHLGNFVIINILSLCIKYDIKFVIIIGGMTGQIGDPSGKKEERKLLDTNQVLKNIEGIKTQLQNLLPNAKIINNADFYKNKTIIDFLRDIGKYVNISYLLNKEIIKSRLETGISFTEFSYSLIQANDFYELHHNEDVDVEVGGSDQWGNITIGIDFINKKDMIPEAQSTLSGLTVKLLLKSDGTKFGKSEKGAIYLSEHLTSAYTMYQFLINQSDADALNLLNFLTNYSINEIQEIITIHQEKPFVRFAQKKLAQNLVSRIHSMQTFEKVKQLSEMIFKNDWNNLTLKDIEMIKNDFPIIKQDFNQGELIVDLLTKAKIFKSKNEAKTLINQGGISINGIKVNDVNLKLDKEFIKFNKYIFIKKGKQEIQIIEK